VSDFGALPPEINSGRLYAGPGSGPMMAAATAWDGLAAELGTASSGYSSIISELTRTGWIGPASMSMVAAATPYATWLGATAQLAEQAGVQARAAAAAYEAAFAMTVPPPEIAANRVLLRSLIATNFFGQNTPAIAATEAQYGEMWAQDAAAMYGYAGSSATASELSPFAPPPTTTTSAAAGLQAAAVEAAATTSAGTSGETVSSMTTDLAATAAVPQALQQLSNALLDPSSAEPWIVSFLGSLTAANRTALVRTFVGLPYFTLGMGQSALALALVQIPGNPASAGGSGSSVSTYWGPTVFATLSPSANPGPVGAYAGPSHLAVTMGRAPLEGLHWAQAQPHPSFGGPVHVAVGKAGALRSMSVPSGWVERVAPQAQTDWATEESLAPVRGAGTNAILTGVNTSGAGAHAGGFVHKYGFRYKVMLRPPYGG